MSQAAAKLAAAQQLPLAAHQLPLQTSPKTLLPSTVESPSTAAELNDKKERLRLKRLAKREKKKQLRQLDSRQQQSVKEKRKQKLLAYADRIAQSMAEEEGAANTAAIATAYGTDKFTNEESATKAAKKKLKWTRAQKKAKAVERAQMEEETDQHTHAQTTMQALNRKPKDQWSKKQQKKAVAFERTKETMKSRGLLDAVQAFVEQNGSKLRRRQRCATKREKVVNAYMRDEIKQLAKKIRQRKAKLQRNTDQLPQQPQQKKKQAKQEQQLKNQQQQLNKKKKQLKNQQELQRGGGFLQRGRT